MKFVLFEKLSELEGLELYMLIGALALVVIFAAAMLIFKLKPSPKSDRLGPVMSALLTAALAFVVSYLVMLYITEIRGAGMYVISGCAAFAVLVAFAAVFYARRSRSLETAKPNSTRALVFGALCVGLSFVLSYFKLFSMPFGGSITLLSMLPVAAYASWFGPVYGFIAAFAYGVLQIIQGAWVVHWAQFILDYFLAFTCLGLASLFPKKLPLGMAVAGIARMICSVISGAVFFGSSAGDYGFSNVWGYSLAYNALTIGVDTALCVIVALLPGIKRVEAAVKY